MHGVTVRLLQTGQRLLVTLVRVKWLHSKQFREQKRLQTVACFCLDKERGDEEQAVIQSADVSQPAENIVSFSSDHKSLKVQIDLHAHELVESGRIFRWVISPCTRKQFFTIVAQILNCLVIA